MYTTLYFPRGIDTPLMQEVEAACNRAKPRTVAEYGDMTVRYSSHGVACQVGQRLLELPMAMREYPPVRVELRASQVMESMDLGSYKRRRAHAIVESSRYRPSNEEPYTVYHFVVIGHSLAAAVRLFDDIMTGKAQPTVKYRQ
jgi:hypothetical protein